MSLMAWLSACEAWARQSPEDELVTAEDVEDYVRTEITPAQAAWLGLVVH